MAKRRQGVCNHCGDCCGANGTFPFVKRHPEAIRTWSLDDVNETYPIYTLCGLGNVGDEIWYISDHGMVRIQGAPYYYKWSPDRGLVKDTSPAHDGSTWSTECPFLEPDPGNGTRPCGLFGTNQDGLRKKMCRPEERLEPPQNYDEWEDRSAQQWQDDHPNCSYTFEDI
jgi:hypothetical protein